MKKTIPAILFIFLSVTSFAQDQCSDMASTPGIINCLEFRNQAAEATLTDTNSKLSDLAQKMGTQKAKNFNESHMAWVKLRNANCKLATVTMSPGEELGITQLACKLAETMKRVREMEAVLDAEKSGTNKFFQDAIEGFAEYRAVNVSAKAIASKFGVNLINKEFNAANQALMTISDVKENRLRIKSIKLIDEGSSSVCANASTYLVELGYYAQKTQKLVKIYVLSDLNADKTIKAIRSTVQENLNDIPVCP